MTTVYSMPSCSSSFIPYPHADPKNVIFLRDAKKRLKRPSADLTTTGSKAAPRSDPARSAVPSGYVCLKPRPQAEFSHKGGAASVCAMMAGGAAERLVFGDCIGIRTDWWIPTRSATPSTALVPQRKVGFPIPNAGLLLGFQGMRTARREGISSPFSDARGCTSPQNSGRQKGAGFLGSKNASHPINAMLNYAYVVEAGRLAKALAARGLALQIAYTKGHSV
jgi:hypothetical protein